MKKLLRENFIEIFSILIVFVDIFYNILPVVPLSLLLIAISLFRMGLLDLLLLSSFALPKVLGYALYTIGISGVASLLEYAVFAICLYQWIIAKKIHFYNYKESFKYFGMTLLLFIISALITTGGDYAITKIKDTFILGTITLFAYGFALSNPNKCNFIRVGLYLVLFSLLMLLLAPLLNEGAGPQNFMDFGYLRRQNLYVLENETLVVSYQTVGFTATMGIGVIMLDSLKKKPNLLFVSLCLLLCIIISLYSGGRQFMVISLAVALIWFLLQGKRGASGWLVGILGIAIVILFISMLFEDGGLLSSVKEEGYLESSNREVIMLKGINDFLNNPVFGIGFGRFEFMGRYGLYPHNIIVESLCELGVVGLLILILISFKSVRYLLKYQTPCLYLFVVFFLRSMTSGGLDDNIIMFSFVFAVLSLKSQTVKLPKIKIDENENKRIYTSHF